MKEKLCVVLYIECTFSASKTINALSDIEHNFTLTQNYEFKKKIKMKPSTIVKLSNYAGLLGIF